jgi:hypothetical protein
LYHTNTDVFEHLLYGYTRQAHVAEQMGRIHAIAARTIFGKRPWCRRIRNERTSDRRRRGEPWLRRPETAGKGIIAAGIQDDDIDAIRRLLHRAEDPAYMHCFELDVLFASDPCPDRHEVILPFDLQSMPREIEESDYAWTQLRAQ